MMNNNYLVLLKTITPLHVGTGRSVGVVDAEIAREKSTHWPVIPGSSVKGVLKSHVMSRLVYDENKREKDAEAQLQPIFGGTVTNGSDIEETYAGSLCASDLRILFFPVRSFYGTFAYVTCPLAVQRFAEVVKLTETNVGDLSSVFSEVDNATCKVVNESSLLSINQNNNNKVFLEDLNFQAQSGLEGIEGLVGVLSMYIGTDADFLKKHMCLVSDTNFTFLTKHATEVRTKVTLEFGTKTAKDGGLRSEESVPPEAIFYGLFTFQKTSKSKDSKEAVTELKMYGIDYLLFGGNSTTGQGFCKFSLVNGE